MRLHHRIVQHENIQYHERVRVRTVQHDHISDQHKQYIILLPLVVYSVQHDIIVQQDRVRIQYVRVVIIVQHDQVVQQDAEIENIEVVHEERVQVIVVQQVHDLMLRIDHVVRQHVDVENGVQHEVQVVVR